MAMKNVIRDQKYLIKLMMTFSSLDLQYLIYFVNDLFLKPHELTEKGRGRIVEDTLTKYGREVFLGPRERHLNYDAALP